MPSPSQFAKNVFRVEKKSRQFYSGDFNACCYNPSFKSTKCALIFREEYDAKSNDLLSCDFNNNNYSPNSIVFNPDYAAFDSFKEYAVIAPLILDYQSIAEICFLVSVSNFDAKKICKPIGLDTNKMYETLVGLECDMFRGSFTREYVEPICARGITFEISNYTMHNLEGIHLMRGLFTRKTKIYFLTQNSSIILTGRHVHPAHQPNFTSRSKFMSIKNCIMGCDKIIDNVWTYLMLPRLNQYPNPPIGAILSGPPGLGKSALALQISKVVDGKFIFIKAGDLKRPTVGSSEQLITQLFQQARDDPNVFHFYLFDEFDAIASKRVNSEVSSHENDIVNQLLAIIGGVDPLPPNVIIFATTNRIDSLDPAITRSGRLDIVFEFQYPDAESRTKMINFYYSKNILACFGSRTKPICPTRLLPMTCNMSGADIETIFKKTALVLSTLGVDEIAEKDVTNIICVEIINMKKINVNKPFIFWNINMVEQFSTICTELNSCQNVAPIISKRFVHGNPLTGKKSFFKAVSDYINFKFVQVVLSGNLAFDLDTIMRFVFDNVNTIYYLPNCPENVSKYFCDCAATKAFKNQTLIVIQSNEEEANIKLDLVDLHNEGVLDKILDHFGKTGMKPILNAIKEPKQLAFGEIINILFNNSRRSLESETNSKPKRRRGCK